MSFYLNPFTGSFDKDTIPVVEIVIPNVICDASVYVGALVYLDSTGKAFNAIATSASTLNIIGMVESKSSSISCVIRVIGVTGELFTGLDTTKNYFLSDTVAGAITTSAIASGHYVLQVGQPFSSTRFMVLKGTAILKA